MGMQNSRRTVGVAGTLGGIWGGVRGTLAAALLAAAAWGVTPGVAAEPTKPADDAATKDQSPPDLLVFPDGRTVEGWILSETATTIKFKGVVKGMTFEREYQRSELLTIKKGASKPGDAPVAPASPEKADTKTLTPPEKKAEPSPSDAATKVERFYWINLKGKLGHEITQRPLRDAMKDARSQNADVVVVSLDAEWKFQDGESAENDAASFDQLFRAEPLTVVLTDEVEKDWPKKPRIVFWVKQAMGGSAFLPLVCPEIYFTSEGRMGGIGNLGELFEGRGDEVVREKQRSLRLGHAEGWAIRGGYDPRLIRAMARREYVLSYRIKDGKPELFEGYPSDPSEELLTDDGKESHADTLRERATNTGNDVLTLTPRVAKILGVSKGTADTKDDLLSELGLDPIKGDVSGKSERIMKDWRDKLASTESEIKKIMDDIRRGPQIKPTGNQRDDRRKVLGTQRTWFERLKRLLEDMQEGLDPGWLRREGVPSVADINTQLEAIRLELLKLK